MSTAISEKVRNLREQTGTGQGALARAAGISQGYMSQIEGGDVKDVSLRVAFGLAGALGVTIYDLLGEEHIEIKILPELQQKLTSMAFDRQRTLLKFLEDNSG